MVSWYQYTLPVETRWIEPRLICSEREDHILEDHEPAWQNDQQATIQDGFYFIDPPPRFNLPHEVYATPSTGKPRRIINGKHDIWIQFWLRANGEEIRLEIEVARDGTAPFDSEFL